MASGLPSRLPSGSVAEGPSETLAAGRREQKQIYVARAHCVGDAHVFEGVIVVVVCFPALFVVEATRYERREDVHGPIQIVMNGARGV